MVDKVISVEGYELPIGSEEVTDSSSVVPVYVSPTTPEQLAEIEAYNDPQAVYEREVAAVKAQRHAAYIAPDGSDALFMKFQRSEDGVTKQAWLDRVAEINAAYPYPEPPAK